MVTARSVIDIQGEVITEKNALRITVVRMQYGISMVDVKIVEFWDNLIQKNMNVFQKHVLLVRLWIVMVIVRHVVNTQDMVSYMQMKITLMYLAEKHNQGAVQINVEADIFY